MRVIFRPSFSVIVPCLFALIVATVALTFWVQESYSAARQSQLPNPSLIPSTDNFPVSPTAMCQTNGQVFDLLYSRDILYIAGTFTKVRPANEPANSSTSVPRNGLAACNTKTGEILDWDPQVTHTDPELFTINTMVLSANEQNLFIGGNFRAVGGSPRKNAAAIDRFTGEPNNWAPPNTGHVFDFALSWDGLTLYRAGGFGVDAYAASGSGVKVEPFTPSLQKADGTPSSARSIALSYDSETLYIGGGSFEKVNEAPRHGAAAVDAATGTITRLFDPDITDLNVENRDLIAQVYDIQLHNGHVYLCGDWWITEGIGDSQRQRNVNRFDPITGVADRLWWPWTDGGLSSCDIDTHNDALIIGGHFDKVGGTNDDDYASAPETRDIAAISLAGGNLVPWRPGTTAANLPDGESSLINSVIAVAGHIFAGGNFEEIGETAQQGVGRFEVGPKALFIVSNPTNPISGDYVLRKRLEINHNMAVKLIDNSTIVGNEADAMDLLLISGSINAPGLPEPKTQFKEASIPVILWYPWLLDDMGMITSQSITEVGTTPAVREIKILDPNHPLAAGLSGNVRISTDESQLSWGNVGESANIVATVFEPTSIELDGGDRPVLFGYPRNAPLPDGSTAAGCRIGIPNYRSAPVSYTDTGWALFDSAINWGLNCPEINMPLPTAITTATVAPTSIATNIPTTAPTAPSTNTPVSTATSTPTSTPIPVVTEAPTATPNSTATPTNTPTATPTSTATSTPPEGDPIPALSVECRDITPPSVQRGEACIAGFVYVDGLPADGVIITVRDQNGVEIAAATTKVYSFPFGETRAYYRTVLSNVQPADSFTVEAEFNGQAVTSPAIVAATGVQQIDLVFSGDDDSRPVATIRRVDQLMIQGTDPLKAEGVGQSANANARIVAWRWVSDRDGLLGEAATLNRPIDGLAYGRHQLSLTVRDSNGVESVPVTTQIDVLNDNQIEWTVLLYLAGDYRDGGTLNRKFIKALRGIGQTLNTPSVRIAAYIDGPNPDDTVSYLIEPSQNGANIIDGPTRISEKAMDAPETLTEFINWGTTEFPSDHTYLVIADHGQVLRGIAWDHTSDLADDGKANLSQFLTVKEIASAIQNSVIQKVDILHFDACTMNLLEAAYELRNQAELMISSQYYGWDFFAYELYAELFNSLDTPHTIANRVIREYASLAKNGNQPFTISALDLGQIKPAMVALNNLSNRLANLLDQGDGQLESDLRTIRSAVQTFDSNENFINDLDDVYIDLIDWSRLVSDRTQNVEVKALSTELIDAVTGSGSLVLGSESSSGHLPALGAEGTFVNLANANGLSIFYPTTANQRYVEYFSSESFAFADESGWRAYLEETEPLMLPPNEPVDPLPGPQQLLSQNQNIFLPVSFR